MLAFEAVTISNPSSPAEGGRFANVPTTLVVRTQIENFVGLGGRHRISSSGYPSGFHYAPPKRGPHALGRRSARPAVLRGPTHSGSVL